MDASCFFVPPGDRDAKVLAVRSLYESHNMADAAIVELSVQAVS